MGCGFAAAGSEFGTKDEGFGFVAQGHDVTVPLVGPRVLRDLGALPGERQSSMT